MGITQSETRGVRAILRPLSRSIRYLQLRLDLLQLRRANLRSKNSVIAPDGPVVSIATYSKRLKTVHLTIESIARGDQLPSRLLLWLDEPAEYANLPEELKRLQSRGLEVKVADRPYGPHKKYYPYVITRSAENASGANGPLVTADDDVLYPREWLSDLVAAYSAAPDFVHCFRARVVELDASGLRPYSTWRLCRSGEPSLLHCAIGVSGVIYPPPFLDFLKDAGTTFLQTCPRADDLWLHVQAIRHGFQVRQIRRNPVHFPIVPGTQQAGLQQQNLHGSGNDEQAKKTYDATDIKALWSAANRSSVSSPS